MKAGDYAIIRNPETIPDGYHSLGDIYIGAVVRVNYDGRTWRAFNVTMVVEGRAPYPYRNRSFELPPAYLVGPLSPAVLKIAYGLEVQDEVR